MAKVSTEGLGAFEQLLLRQNAAATAAVPKMLQAGAAVVIAEQKAQIRRMGLVDSGDMEASIKATPIKTKGTARFVYVYPQGKDRKGVRNATKGFVAEYGSSKQVRRPWFTAAGEASPEVQEAMRKAWEEAQNGGGRG